MEAGKAPNSRKRKQSDDDSTETSAPKKAKLSQTAPQKRKHSTSGDGEQPTAKKAKTKPSSPKSKRKKKRADKDDAPGPTALDRCWKRMRRLQEELVSSDPGRKAQRVRHLVLSQMAALQREMEQMGVNFDEVKPLEVDGDAGENAEELARKIEETGKRRAAYVEEKAAEAEKAKFEETK